MKICLKLCNKREKASESDKFIFYNYFYSPREGERVSLCEVSNQFLQLNSLTGSSAFHSTPLWINSRTHPFNIFSDNVECSYDFRYFKQLNERSLAAIAARSVARMCNKIWMFGYVPNYLQTFSDRSVCFFVFFSPHLFHVFCHLVTSVCTSSTRKSL